LIVNIYSSFEVLVSILDINHLWRSLFKIEKPLCIPKRGQKALFVMFKFGNKVQNLFVLNPKLVF